MKNSTCKKSEASLFILGAKNYYGMVANMKVNDFDPANQFVKREYRGSYKLDI